MADGLSWALQCEGVANLIHYLDDFFFWSEEGSPDCARALSMAVPLCHRLGLPVAPQKVAGPSTSIVFLGIFIDSARQEIRLPEKLARLWLELRAWGDRRSASKRQLQSLIGLLNHAAKVVRPDGPFLRTLIDTMRSPTGRTRRSASTSSVGGALCGGRSFWWLGMGSVSSPEFPFEQLCTLMHQGCGAFILGSAEWLQLCWPHSGQVTGPNCG